MKTTPKQTPSYYSPLLILVLLALFMPGTALADCPDKAVKCNTFTKGWQGTCFKGISCKPCGPQYCPKRPLLKDMRSRAILDAPAGKQCRATITKSKLEYEGTRLI